MRVLGIETSCDETGLAIYDSEKGLMGHVLYSQIKLHAIYGGVVPELASRDHVKVLVPLMNEVLLEAGCSKQDIDLVAYTAGPGLVGALLTGACFAKALAYGLGIPALAIHHLEAHLLAAQMEEPRLQFPFLALLVSGGHTQFIHARALGDYEVLGETLDDAVGEAFDKTAKLMGIPYPGGPHLAQLADEEVEISTHVSPFPRPMLDRPGLDLSFSGLKTHALMTWNASQKDESAKRAIARAFQTAVVETLVKKCQRAMKQVGQMPLVVAGGVGANRALRESLANHFTSLYFPKLQYCTDNGAMVAYAGWCHGLKKEQDASLEINVRARWPFS